MECKQTMYVGSLCRLKYGLLWVPINTFLFAQMSPNLANSFVRCYSSSCEILKSMRLKSRKMLFFIFLFQMGERFLYFFPSQIRYGVFDVYNLKKKSWKKIKYYDYKWWICARWHYFWNRHWIHFFRVPLTKSGWINSHFLVKEYCF